MYGVNAGLSIRILLDEIKNQETWLLGEPGHDNPLKLGILFRLTDRELPHPFTHPDVQNSTERASKFLL